MIKLLKRLKMAEWVQVFASLLFIVAQVWLDLRLPDFMSEITKLTQIPGSELADIWRAGAKMLICALGSVISATAVGFFAARIAASFSQRMGADAHYHGIADAYKGSDHGSMGYYQNSRKRICVDNGNGSYSRNHGCSNWNYYDIYYAKI